MTILSDRRLMPAIANR